MWKVAFQGQCAADALKKGVPIDAVLIEKDVEINTANVPTNVEYLQVDCALISDLDQLQPLPPSYRAFSVPQLCAPPPGATLSPATVDLHA
jgi:hypothetical protein